MNPLSRNVGLWLVLLVMCGIVYVITNTNQQPRTPEITFSRFMQAVEGRVGEVVIQDHNIRGRYKAERGEAGEGFKTFAPEEPDLVRRCATRASRSRRSRPTPNPSITRRSPTGRRCSS